MQSLFAVGKSLTDDTFYRARGMNLFKMVAGGLTNWLIHDVQEKGIPLCDFERIRHEVKPCDVLLVTGRSRVSKVIKQTTQSPWSHAMLYIGRLHDIEDDQVRQAVSKSYDGSFDEQLIIESELGIGTEIQPLKKYQGEHLRICRPKGLCYKDSQKVIHYAVSRLGMDYNVRQILDLARFFFPYSSCPDVLAPHCSSTLPDKRPKPSVQP